MKLPSSSKTRLRLNFQRLWTNLFLIKREFQNFMKVLILTGKFQELQISLSNSLKWLSKVFFSQRMNLNTSHLFSQLLCQIMMTPHQLSFKFSFQAMSLTVFSIHTCKKKRFISGPNLQMYHPASQFNWIHPPWTCSSLEWKATMEITFQLRSNINLNKLRTSLWEKTIQLYPLMPMWASNSG